METLYSLFLLFIFFCFVGGALFFLWSEYSEKGKKWSKDNQKKQQEMVDNLMSDYEKKKKQNKTQQSKIICKFCGEKGGISKKKVTLKEENREKGIVGATIGRKTITKKEATQLTCKNCGMEWTL